MKRKRIRINDISVAYVTNEIEGEPQETIIFLHGFPFNKNMWLEQLVELPAGVQGIALDIRGHGSSTRGHGFFSIDLFADDLLAFIDQLNLVSVILCGVSMGGYVALRAYEKRATAFKGMVLVDTHPFPDTNEGKEKRFDTIQSVLTHGKRAFSIHFAEKVFSKVSIKRKPQAVELIKSAIRRNTETNICSTLLALAARTDTSTVLKDINVPVLLVRGGEDTIVSREQMKQMEQDIPDVRYIEMDDCGHLPNLENPSRFNGEIRNFMISKIMA